jgi:hypothetical protein
MANYEIVSGMITKVGRQEAETVLSSVKIGKTLLTNVKVPNQAFFDLIKEGDHVIVGYRMSTFSNFTARFIENMMVGNKSSYEKQKHFDRYGRDVGKSEQNYLFYIRNSENGDEIFYKGAFPPMKYVKRIFFAGCASILIPIVQYFGIFAALYMIFFSKYSKDHYTNILEKMRKA